MVIVVAGVVAGVAGACEWVTFGFGSYWSILFVCVCVCIYMCVCVVCYYFVCCVMLCVEFVEQQ